MLRKAVLLLAAAFVVVVVAQEEDVDHSIEGQTPEGIEGGRDPLAGEFLDAEDDENILECSEKKCDKDFDCDPENCCLCDEVHTPYTLEGSCCTWHKL